MRILNRSSQLHTDLITSLQAIDAKRTSPGTISAEHGHLRRLNECMFTTVSFFLYLYFFFLILDITVFLIYIIYIFEYAGDRFHAWH